MGLKNWFYKTFITERYNRVDQGYRSAKATYKEGVDLFISIHYDIDDPNNFDLKECICKNYSDIADLDKYIKRYDVIKANYKNGYIIFLKENRISEISKNTSGEKKYEFIKKIVDSEDRIIKIEETIKKSNFIFKKNKHAVTRFIGKRFFNDIKTRELVVANEKEIIRLQNIYNNYDRLTKKYKNGLDIYLTIKSIDDSNISYEEMEEACQTKSSIKNYQDFHDNFCGLFPEGLSPKKYLFNTKCLFRDIIQYIKEKGDDVIPNMLNVLFRFKELLRDYPKVVNLYVGENVTTQSIIDAVSNFDLLKISGELIKKRVNVSTTKLNLFDLTLSDVKIIDNSKIKEKKQFLEYIKIKVEKESSPLFSMTTTASPILHSVLNATNSTLEFENTNANCLEFCSAVKTLYNNKWTIQKALDYIKENKERIFLYCRQNNLKQELTVSTLEVIVKDYDLVNFLKLTDAEIKQMENELQQARKKVEKIVHDNPRAVENYVNNGKLKKYSNEMTLTDCKNYINNEQAIQFLETQCISIEEEYRQIQKNRNIATSIKQSYPKGYNYYVKIGSIRDLTPSLTLQELEKIVNLEQLIISKHQEIERQEKENKRKAEEAARINTAKMLAFQYSKAYNALFPYLSSDNITGSNCCQIINQESALRSLNTLFSSVSEWKNVKDIPYFHFYHYYPKRFSDITSESQRVRNLIYNFKIGIEQSEVIEIMTSKLNETFNSSQLRELTLVCIPASSKNGNECRYKTFSQNLCEVTGMSNGFNHIKITKEKTPSHLGGSDEAQYSLDDSWFSGRKVIMFDDVVTQGHSMKKFKELLSGVGAIVICAMSIGRTYSDYYGDNRTPHPWTGFF